MGWRFRRSIKILPGVRMNFGKKGVTSFTFGKGIFSTNVNKKGVRRNVNIPGTGLTYQTKRTPHQGPPGPVPQIQEGQVTRVWCCKKCGHMNQPVRLGCETCGTMDLGVRQLIDLPVSSYVATTDRPQVDSGVKAARIALATVGGIVLGMLGLAALCRLAGSTSSGTPPQAIP